MIHVSNLTKFYGDYAAVQDVSFDVPQGQIVGFLGPNGAGKSTTMRILAGYLNATSGQASIDGIDVFWDSVEVRRRIGYMPENCPLYPEMRVLEYLRFRAGIKGLYGQQREERVNYVLRRCWLNDVSRQIIGTLSKGYKQRVGLADALVANPPVLILDEPTAGLDPTQIRATRQLIRELGRQHTILLSTHILPEVEMTCDSVILIHQGRVALQGPLAELSRQAGEHRSLVVTFDTPVDKEHLGSLPGVSSVEARQAAQGTQVSLGTSNAEELSTAVCSLAVSKGWQIRELRSAAQTLEDLFVSITGHEQEGLAARG